MGAQCFGLGAQARRLDAHRAPASECWAPNANPLTGNNFSAPPPNAGRPVGAQFEKLGAQT
ncbi:hypothetical protein Sp245p_31770 (plasmid) [Azospirillum baldaniorum]|nr:hypothetical protein Sp245p_31770 [Azospirillum baldaniorum]